MDAKNADFDAILATHRTVFDLVWQTKMTVFYTMYKVLASLAGFGGLVKRTQKITEAIVRGLAWPGCRVCAMQARSSNPGKRITRADKVLVRLQRVPGQVPK